ncbi:MAG: hypothetical protein NT062_38550 [Proteobacteria bacterium]|nr:hypothetical protein [Pseudomonadota bacterium]
MMNADSVVPSRVVMYWLPATSFCRVYRLGGGALDAIDMTSSGPTVAIGSTIVRTS